VIPIDQFFRFLNDYAPLFGIGLIAFCAIAGTVRARRRYW
jgi:hypothetical protein